MDILKRVSINYEIVDYKLMEVNYKSYGVEGPYLISELKIKIDNDEPKWFDMRKDVASYNLVEYMWDKFYKKEGKVMKKEGCYNDLIGRKGVGNEVYFSDGKKGLDLEIL